VEGVAGAAVVGVVLYDAGWWAGGWVAQDAFLVLAGFAATRALLAEPGAVRRRFKRLLAPVAGTVLATLGLVALLGGVAPARRTGADAVAGLLQYANWHQVHSGASTGPLGHLWALGVVEQGALALAVVVLVARRDARALTVAFGLSFVAAGLVGPLLAADGASAARLALGTDARAVDLLAGAAAATLLAFVHSGGRWLSTVVGLAALAGLVVTGQLGAGAGGGDPVGAGPAGSGPVGGGAGPAGPGLGFAAADPWAAHGGRAGVAALVAVLVVAAGRGTGPLSRRLSAGVLAELGRTSYVIYLLHVPVLWALGTALPNLRPYAVLIIGGLGTWLLAQVTHYVVGERLAVRPWRALVAGPAMLALGTTIAVAGDALPAAAEAALRPAGRPVILALGGPLAGDVARAAVETGRYGAVDASIPACGVMAPAAVRWPGGPAIPTSPECADRTAVWRRHLSTVEYRAVVVELSWDAADQRVDGAWLSPCDQAYRRAYPGRLKGALEEIWAARPGVRVLLAVHPDAACLREILAHVVSVAEVGLLCPCAYGGTGPPRTPEDRRRLGAALIRTLDDG
jgi:peptidoglycan/LPS O-acetylase OafA/YrhL